MRFSTLSVITALFLVFSAPVAGQHGVIDYYAVLAPTPEAVPLAPLFDATLTDASITLADDGFYYLTGSAVEDGKAVFSKTVVIWRSSDLKVWDVVRRLEFDDFKAGAPEIHWLDGAFYLTFGRENGGTHLLRFESKDIAKSAFCKAEITSSGSDPSIFRDDDGTFYWVYGAGYVGKMKSDPLAGLDGEMKRVIAPFLQPGNRRNANVGVKSSAMRGAFLTKINGFYHLFVGERRLKFQNVGRTGLPFGTDDVFVAVSSKPDEGYDEAYRYLAFPSAGQTTLFRHKDDSLWATFSCTDSRGIFSFKPGAFPVEIVDASKPVWATGFAGTDEPVLYAPHKTLVRPSRDFVYENGVGLARPVPFEQVPSQKRDVPWIRDTNITRGGDGNYYMTGTSGDMDAIHLWKSSDLKRFDYFGEAFRFQTPSQSPEAWYNRKGATRLLWAPEIHYLKDNYWIVFSVNEQIGMGFLKSTTGKPEGPYVPTYPEDHPFIAPNIDASLFVDTDGTPYYIWQGKFLQRLSPDFSRLEGEKMELLTTDGEQVGYEGIFMFKEGDWYVICAAEWNGGGNRLDGTYDTMYAVSKNLAGPYSPRRVLAPHTGHSTIFKDASGRWRIAFFGNDRSAPFRASVGIASLILKESNGELLIEINEMVDP